MSRITKLIRKVMREHDRRSIWNNKYKNCTTVKCYVHRRGYTRSELETAICDKLIREGYRPVEHFTIDMRHAPNRPMLTSFIVRIPNGVE